mgnify:CR=1 FL=1
MIQLIGELHRPIKHATCNLFRQAQLPFSELKLGRVFNRWEKIHGKYKRQIENLDKMAAGSSRSNGGIRRVLSKLNKCIEEGNFYEGHQMIRTIYFRYVLKGKVALVFVWLRLSCHNI